MPALMDSEIAFFIAGFFAGGFVFTVAYMIVCAAGQKSPE
jgi:hypothetical protein